MIKDNLLSWLVSNLILSNRQKFDYPGFIIEDLGGKPSRQFFLPESVFARLEKVLEPQISYNIGKKWGYTLSRNSDIPQKKSTGFAIFLEFFVKLVETTYAKNITFTTDLKKSKIQFVADDFTICRKNGLGNIISEGGIAGIWAWMMDDLSVEAIQTQCQGRGDSMCVMIAAPISKLTNDGLKPRLTCKNVSSAPQEWSKYLALNSVRKVSYAKNSFRDLWDAHFFGYHEGKMEYHGERFFLGEASIMYVLEETLQESDKKGKRTGILWNECFNYGVKLAKLSKSGDSTNFIMDFFPALGYGDILVLKKDGKFEILINNFPWFSPADKIDFVFIGAMLSGILTCYKHRPVKLVLSSKVVSEAGFQLVFKER